TMFTRGINGAASDHYSGACLSCHTVGYDEAVSSNGFDDAASATGWSMPPMSGGNWDSLIASRPSLAKLANIQCENCHGPQDSAAHTRTWDGNQKSQPFLSPRIAYASENCATCHAAGAHHIYSEWSTLGAGGLGHANRGGTSFAAGATGLNASCGRCHSAQGYTLYAGLLGQGKVALNSIPAATLATVTPANVEPVTCVACHDPHDAANPNQLRFFGDTPNLPSGFAGYGMGKGALCLTCHNSRNGVQTGSDALTWLHEDGEPYNGGNPTGYSAPHQAAQGDVFAGHNAYFLGSSLPMTSMHAAVQDTCVGCHMTLQPKGYLSHGAPARSGHLFRIEEADQQALCANCHGSAVDGAGIQGQVESQLARLAVAMGNAVKARINGFPGGLIRVRAWDPATDLYSSTSASNLVLDVVANPVTAVDVEEVHGQIGFVLHFATPITVPFVDAAGNPAPSKALTSFGVQMGAIKDNQATPAPLYTLSGNLVRAGWNYFLVEGDGSKGLHNPGFVTAVLNATLGKDLSH
ncbi:MAG: cytochrome c3 family protein, partial [Deltaproteobacteria bacterium]